MIPRRAPRFRRGPEPRPTVLVYGHFDASRPTRSTSGNRPCSHPSIRGEYLYGRGVADDKGQLYMLPGGARPRAGRRVPGDVRFACDGEEESGGHSIVDFLRRRPGRRRGDDLRLGMRAAAPRV